MASISVQRHAGFRERFPQRGHEGVQMGAGGDLRDDAAEADMFLHRGGDGVGQQLVPRTIPTPVSSQDDSMPRTKGSLCWVRFMGGLLPGAGACVSGVGGAEPEAHDQGVDAVAVVPGPDVDLFEAEAEVQLLGPGVVRPDFQEHVVGVAQPAFPDEFGQQCRADALAFLLRHDGDGLDVRDRLDAHQPGVAHDVPGALGHQVAARLRLRQLIEEHLQRPGVHREQPALQFVHDRDVRRGHVPQRHPARQGSRARRPGRSQRPLPGTGDLGVGLAQVERGGVQQLLPRGEPGERKLAQRERLGLPRAELGDGLDDVGVDPGPGTVDREVRQVSGETDVWAVQQLAGAARRPSA